MGRTLGLVAVVTALAVTLVSAGPLSGERTQRTSSTPRTLKDLPFSSRGPIAAAVAARDPAYEMTGLSVRNRTAGLAARFAPSGVDVRGASSRLALSLQAYGRGRQLTPVAPVMPRDAGNRVTYDHGPLTEWYANSELGLEQGFDVRRPPAGGGDGPLTLTMRLTTSGPPRLSRGLLDVGALEYRGLTATDAGGRRLDAHLTLGRSRLSVSVDDQHARYPVHVDPFVQRAQLTYTKSQSGEDAGDAVGISGDTIVVGGPGHTLPGKRAAGAAYVFIKPAKGWANMSKPTAVLTAPDAGSLDTFGSAVAISGDTVLVGAPGHRQGTRRGVGAAYIYEKPSTGWVDTSTPQAEFTPGTPPAKVFPGFGTSVALAPGAALVGAPFAKVGAKADQGAAYLFTEPAGGWVTTSGATVLESFDGAASDIFGNSVALSDDTAVVGAPCHVVGANRCQGSIYVWNKPAAGWTSIGNANAELFASDGQDSDEFGSSVAVSGATIAVGVPERASFCCFNHGILYVYTKPPSGWADTGTPAAELSSSTGQGDDLGVTVAVSGASVFGGAPLRQETNVNQGAVLEFDKPPSGWATSTTPSAEITDSPGAPGDALGMRVAIDGTTLVAGAIGHDIGTRTDAGAAYVFDSRPPPKPTVKITAPANRSAYVQGQVVDASYSCADAGGPGLAGCAGPVASGAPIDTSTVGSHTFTVTATDTSAQTTTVTVGYVVSARLSPPPPLQP